jgi:YfaZ precursor
LQAGFKLRQDVRGVQGLRFGLGFKGTYTEVGNQKHSAIPLGVELAYTLPIDSVVPIIISGTLDYAPSVLSFKDADSYMEKRLELGVQIVEQATIFVGYRKIDTDFEAHSGGDYTFNDTGYIGFKIRF